MRLSYKLLLISELVLLTAVVALVVPVWNAMRDQVVENMQNELKAIASTAALQIDGDLHRRIRLKGDEDSEAFRLLRDQLEKVRIANNIKEINQIYTFYHDGSQMRFAVMLNPPGERFVGATYPIREQMIPVLEEGTIEATQLYTDEHGRWISAYAPIVDSRGEIVGLLEVDKNSDEYFVEFYYYTRLTIALGLLALALSSLLGWWVLTRVVIKPISLIREGMLALGRHDFRHRVELATNDELQDLGRTLNNISQQLDLAHVVQKGFFPKELPRHPKYRIAATFVTCDATGGDYYDAFALEDGRIAIVVADVSGHGLGPSLLMASCRSALRGLSRTDLSPGELVDRLSHHLAADLTDGRFITLIYGILDDEGTMTYANCGHGPALAAAEGRVRRLESHRPPLGVVTDLIDEPRQSTLALSPGDRVFLASDGLTEALNTAGRQLGVAAVEKIVIDRSVTSEGVVQRLLDLLREHQGQAAITDDVTLLCVDRV
ncbi:MAG: PP2C family protein-serine/threonine phosphatase [Planctomycetota bacterium]|jgi:serine phosphatase RsbU (regulator of sigma subunit)